ncbi:hypothetical protein G6F40_013455 [Rhizopus arrhizus]|nr:hypothetical protein G6F40_013455 [Rhizopus arrhizus]
MRFRGGGCLSRGYRSPLLDPLHLLHASVDLGLLIGPVGGRPAGVHLLLIQALGGSTSTVSSCSILVQGLGAFDQAAAVDLVAKFGDVHQALPVFCIARSRAAFWSSRTARSRVRDLHLWRFGDAEAGIPLAPGLAVLIRHVVADGDVDGLSRPFRQVGERTPPGRSGLRRPAPPPMAVPSAAAAASAG